MSGSTLSQAANNAHMSQNRADETISKTHKVLKPTSQLLPYVNLLTLD
jgi:hypothetical protein